MTISNFSTIAANNDNPAPGGAPEGMAPGQVNNVIRENMADQRLQWNDGQWFEYRDGTPDGLTTYVSANQFQISGADVSLYYHVGRRLKISGASDLYGSITAVSYGAGITTVTVDVTLSNEIFTVYSGILSADNHSLPRIVVQDIIGTMVAGNVEAGIDVTYDDIGGKLDFNVSVTDENFTTALKTKLDGVEISANAYTHPSTSGNKHIPVGGASGQFLKYSASGTAIWAADNDTVYSHPTTAGNKHIPSGGAAGGMLQYSASGTATWIAVTRTTSTAIPTGGSDGDIHYIHEV